MLPSLLQRRTALLTRGDGALDRWPDRQGPQFVREMTAVAEGLEAIAVAADRGGGDRLDRARTWRQVGNAYFDLNREGGREQLEHAAAAFRTAEILLEGANEPVEALKLDYSFGQTLMLLCAAKDLQFASAARDRFANALRLAREHLPDGVSSLERALQDAEQVVQLLEQADGLGRRIEQLKAQLGESQPGEASAKPRPSPATAEIQALFGDLQAEFEKDKPNLEVTRRTGLEDFMERLGKLVASESNDKTLDDMQAGRGKLDGLIREIQAQGKKPSLTGPGAPAGSRSERILAALQDLKMFVWTAGMKPSAPTGLRETAIDLFPRIGRLTTWISEAGSDADKVRQLEADQARGLANEVRLYARRAHLMLAKPVWPPYDGLIEANRIFFSGPERLHEAVVAAAASLDLELNDGARAGADFAEQRWHDLRAANVAVFDLSEADPQVYYEIGIALAVGAQLLLTAEQGADVPFDVAQNVCRHPPKQDLRAFFVDEVDRALYGLHVRGAKATSLAATRAYAELLAAADSESPLLGAALQSVRNAGADPVKLQDALTTFNSYLGANQHEILLPRWPGGYPDPRAPRCFAVMPFREGPERAYDVVADAARAAGIDPIRGDVADGQQIVESIWQEICTATHVTVDLTGLNLNVCLELGIAHALGRPTWLIGAEGTERRLSAALPGVAKWRCHTYAADPRAKPEFAAGLGKFFRRTRAL